MAKAEDEGEVLGDRFWFLLELENQDTKLGSFVAFHRVAHSFLET